MKTGKKIKRTFGGNPKIGAMWNKIIDKRNNRRDEVLWDSLISSLADGVKNIITGHR